MEIKMANPRGFCAGVDRAIAIVNRALDVFGAPIYVRHEIVHNKYVVDSLREKGAVFVEELDEIPDTDAPVIFSAHGVAKIVPEEAKRRNFFFLDATCPLVSKVHIEAERLYEQGAQIILIGHAGHPEVIGTMGQLPKGAVTLVETVKDAENFEPATLDNLSYITQTTLSVDDTQEIVDCLKKRFPKIKSPKKEDICYATTNRQEAVKEIAKRAEALIVIGAETSSNSKRLVEVGERHGCKFSVLAAEASLVDFDALENHSPQTIGITAGASAPEHLVQEVVTALEERYSISVETIETAKEDVTFKIPRILTE